MEAWRSCTGDFRGQLRRLVVDHRHQRVDDKVVVAVAPPRVSLQMICVTTRNVSLCAQSVYLQISHIQGSPVGEVWQKLCGKIFQIVVCQEEFFEIEFG